MKTKIIICALLCIGLVSFTSMDKLPDDKYAGDWAITVEDTPEGDMSLTMTISYDEEHGYSGTLISDVGDIELEKFSITDDKLLGFFMYQEGDFELSGTFDGDDFEGEIYGMDMTFTTNGKRVKE